MAGSPFDPQFLPCLSAQVRVHACFRALICPALWGRTSPSAPSPLPADPGAPLPCQAPWFCACAAASPVHARVPKAGLDAHWSQAPQGPAGPSGGFRARMPDTQHILARGQGSALSCAGCPLPCASGPPGSGGPGFLNVSCWFYLNQQVRDPFCQLGNFSLPRLRRVISVPEAH